MRDNTIACMATMPGREKQCKKAVDSLLRQVDHVFVYRNPNSSFTHSKATILTGPELGDVGKFTALSLIDKNCFYFTCDDDLIYHDGYVDRHLQFQHKFKNSSITTYHGRTFSKYPIQRYYRNHSKFYSCLNDVDNHYQIEFPGTGVSCFHTSVINPKWRNFEYINMSDVFMGIEAKRENVDIFVIPHKKGEIIEQQSSIGIWKVNNRSDDIHVDVINRLYSV